MVGESVHRSARTWPERARTEGQGLVEFALILPILALILLGLLQFAFIFGAQIGITNAVREAARDASVVTTVTDADVMTNGSWTFSQLTGTLLPSYVQSYQSGSLKTGTPPAADITEVCYSTYVDAAGRTQAQVKVEAQYVHPLFIPLISGILSGLDGDPADGGLRIGASETIRVENGPDKPVPAFSPRCVAS